jgi:glycosyltransferase involved in cell wall biosynthesis
MSLRRRVSRAGPRTSPRADVAVYSAGAGPLYGGVGVAGGAELQSFYIARALALGGFRVRHVVASAGICRTPEGVEVLELPPHYAVRGLSRRRAIVDGLRAADARVYIQRPAGIETGFTGVVARVLRRKFVFSASSDADFMRDREQLRLLGGNLEVRSAAVQYRIGLRCAHAIVVQTERQARLAEETVGRRPQLIPNFSDLGDRQTGSPDVFVWIGAFAGVKDPLSYVALAERVPEARFVMVAKPRTGWDELAREVQRRASALSNLEVVAPMPRDELLELYGRAIAVVSTSEYEGFSNVFLEGWSRGVPALSLRVDPDGVIARHGLGAVAGGSLHLLAASARGYLEDRSRAVASGDAAYRYVERTHAPEVVGPQWTRLVRALLT